MVRLDGAVARMHRRAFDDGQEVALHAFTRHVRPRVYGVAGYLVYLVYEHHARLLGALDGILQDRFYVHELVSFFVGEDAPGFAHRHAPHALTLFYATLQGAIAVQEVAERF